MFESDALLGSNPSTYTPLNLPQGSASDVYSQGYAHGGSVIPKKSAHRDYTVAHFNPQELDALDHLQGWRADYKPKGYKEMRVYEGLEHIARNPHLARSIHHHTKQHLASGGQAHMMGHAYSRDGMHGDTALGLVGPHFKHFLDAYAPPSERINPHDGHPQYFSLSGLIGGLGSSLMGGIGDMISPLASGVGKAISGIPVIGGALSSVAREAAPVLGGMAGDMFGGPVGGMLGSQAGSWLGNKAFGGNSTSSYQPGMSASSQLSNAANAGMRNYAQQQGGSQGMYGRSQPSYGSPQMPSSQGYGMPQQQSYGMPQQQSYGMPQQQQNPYLAQSQQQNPYLAQSQQQNPYLAQSQQPQKNMSPYGYPYPTNGV